MDADHQSEDSGVLLERERVVKFLITESKKARALGFGAFAALTHAAGAIERGEHLR